MDFPCQLPVAVGVLLLSAAAAPAGAQTYRTDAEAYPCARNAQLAVVQSESGFSIRERQERPATPVAQPAIRIGNSLSLDSGIFARTSLVRTESNHVPQR